MSTQSTVESLLFVSVKPLSVKKIAEIADLEVRETEAALEALLLKYGEAGNGVVLVKSSREYQLMTAPESAPVVQKYLKDEMSGELTRPSLEALTIIAYRGPVTKAEVEQIRGVNCTLILRNLLVRGLIEAEEDKKLLQTRYRVTLDFLRFVGVGRVEDLPDYQALAADKTLTDLLAVAKPESAPEA